MRASVVMVLLLSLAALLWLTRSDPRPITIPEQPRPPQRVDVPVPPQAMAAPRAATSAEPVAHAPQAPAFSAARARSTARDAVAAPMSEGDLLQDGAWVDVEGTVRLASTYEGFNQLLQMLASSSSVENSQRQASYQNLFMSDPLYLSGDLQVGQVTCGESVCAAFVTGPTAQQLTAFIARLRSSQRPPIYSLTTLEVPAGSSRAGTRLIFSIKLVRDSMFSIGRRPRT